MAFSLPSLAPKPWIRNREKLPLLLPGSKNHSIAPGRPSFRFQPTMSSTDTRIPPQDCPPPLHDTWRSIGYRQSAESRQLRFFSPEARDRYRQPFLLPLAQSLSDGWELAQRFQEQCEHLEPRPSRSGPAPRYKPWR